MRQRGLIVLLLACAMTACTSDRAVAPDKQEHAAGQPSPPIGSDRDAHGCIGSAGYSWCQATQQCERPWELAKARGFESTAEGFAAFCGK